MKEKLQKFIYNQELVTHIMLKKLFTLGIALAMLFSLTACGNIKQTKTNLEDFDLDDFTNAFFEENTLILVKFAWPHLLYEYLDFYTVFAENGKLIFLIEVTDPFGGGERVVDDRVFAVIVPNAVFNNYEIGESRVFETYNFDSKIPTENCREWLNEIEENSVEHRAGFISNVTRLNTMSEIIVISSVESLKKHFRILG